MSEDAVSMAALELDEYLFAKHLEKTASKCEADKGNWDQLVHESRTCFFWHRMQVMVWLMSNGVEIPIELLNDQTHKPVGYQYPETGKP